MPFSDVLLTMLIVKFTCCGFIGIFGPSITSLFLAETQSIIFEFLRI